MIFRMKGMLSLAAVAALAAGGCAADGTLSTASINNAKPGEAKTAIAVDPACVALTNQIEMLRKDAALEGLEKASSGKGASVKVKRDALAKQAELNRVNADFQSKCGPKIPVQQAAQTPAQPQAAAQTAAVQPAATQAGAAAAQKAAPVAAQVAPVAAEAAAAAKRN